MASLSYYHQSIAQPRNSQAKITVLGEEVKQFFLGSSSIKRRLATAITNFGAAQGDHLNLSREQLLLVKRVWRSVRSANYIEPGASVLHAVALRHPAIKAVLDECSRCKYGEEEAAAEDAVSGDSLYFDTQSTITKDPTTSSLSMMAQSLSIQTEDSGIEMNSRLSNGHTGNSMTCSSGLSSVVPESLSSRTPSGLVTGCRYQARNSMTCSSGLSSAVPESLSSRTSTYGQHRNHPDTNRQPLSINIEPAMPSQRLRQHSGQLFFPPKNSTASSLFCPKQSPLPSPGHYSALKGHKRFTSSWEEHSVHFTKLYDFMIEECLRDQRRIILILRDIGARHCLYRKFGFRANYWRMLSECTLLAALRWGNRFHKCMELYEAWIKIITFMQREMREGYSLEIQRERCKAITKARRRKANTANLRPAMVPHQRTSGSNNASPVKEINGFVESKKKITRLKSIRGAVASSSAHLHMSFLSVKRLAREMGSVGTT